MLLHGLGTDRRIWLYQVPVLCARVPTILVDLRGHGRSSAPDAEWTIGDMAHDVVRLLRYLGAERAHLVGLSMGGMVAQQFALDYPYATASLVLAGTVCGLPQAAAHESLRFIETHSMAEVATDAHHGRVQRRGRSGHAAASDRGRRPQRQAGYERAARAVFGFSVCARLEQIDTPTLVIAGEGDRTVPLASMEELAKRIRGARLVRIPGAAHISNMERPQEFNRAVLEFLGV